MRRVLSLTLVLAAVALLAGSARAQRGQATAYAYGTGGSSASVAKRLAQAPSGFTGGPTTAANGEVVNIFVQSELAATEPDAIQRWADTLTSFLHGPEIATVSVYLASLDRVARLCGPQALGCYGSNRIVTIAEDADGASAASVLAHEYGHHVAESRDNAPWAAVDWGTKRWATYLSVCRRTSGSELFPGDEGRNYELNPGEAFAEDYRVLNERLAGIPETPWEVVDRSLYPDQPTLDLLAQDVTTPWTGPTTITVNSRIAAGASGRGFPVSTPLDGTFRATLVSPPKARFTLRLVDFKTGARVATDVTGPDRVKTIGTTVCGQRSLQVQVKRITGAGPFTLTISKP